MPSWYHYDLDDMNITKINRNYVIDGARTWKVDREYFDPIYNYLVLGYDPGSFFTALLANDAMGAIQRSHPGNKIPNLKNLVGWIQDRAPRESFGDYKKVYAWTKLPAEDRRKILEDRRFLLDEKTEVMMVLDGRSDKIPEEPFMW